MNKFFMLALEQHGNDEVTVAMICFEEKDVDALIELRKNWRLVSNELPAALPFDEIVATIAADLLTVWYGKDVWEEVADAPEGITYEAFITNGFVEISHTFYQACTDEVDIEYHKIHADDYGVYWTAYVEDTDDGIKTQYLPWAVVDSLKVAFDAAGTEAAKASANG